MAFFRGSYVFAQDQPTRESRILEKFNEFDSDKDGKISLDEFMASGPNRSEEGFKVIDTDGDGFVSQEEFEEAIMKKKWQKHRKSKLLEEFNEFDSDKDGKISLDEFMASGPNRSEEGFKVVDTDGDGFVSQEEFKKAIQQIHLKRKRKTGSSS
jgi:Ca2+-binding EF-hand superfamily protein